MRLWILSDLHIESCRWDVPDPRPDFDVFVAAGDIHDPASAGVSWLAERAKGKPVIYVPGNHEWYAPRRMFSMEEELPRARALAQELGVHFLMDDEVILEGVRFLGASLWTDYDLFGAPAAAMAWAQISMNDHRLIFPRTGGPALEPAEARAWHLASRAWLAERLGETPAGRWDRTVVVTHHLPHRASIAPRYATDPLTAAFCSDLAELVEQGGASLWVHGHTHSSCDYRAGATRVVCNPKGYGPRSPGGPIENPRFDPAYVVVV